MWEREGEGARGTGRGRGGEEKDDRGDEGDKVCEGYRGEEEGRRRLRTRNVPPTTQRGLPEPVPMLVPRLRSKMPPRQSVWVTLPRFMSSGEIGQLRPPNAIVMFTSVLQAAGEDT